MADTIYPPFSFYFQLEIEGSITPPDNAFQEASGLSVEWEQEEVREGGQNLYKHRLPSVPKYANLVLKRGFVNSNSALATWCAATLVTNFSKPLVLRDVQLTLLKGDGQPLASWAFRDAWPVKWSMSDFKSKENALAIETLEFAYSALQRL